MPYRVLDPRAPSRRPRATARALGLLLFVWLGATAGALAGQAVAPPPPPSETLRLAVSRGTVSLPVYVAEAKGFFAREGIAVQLHDCASGRQCFGLLSQGTVDVATAAELVMTLNALSGSDAAIVATLGASSQQIKLVVRTPTGPSSALPGLLRGKRIGTVAGTSAQYYLASWLLYHDVPPGDVTVVALPPEQLADALLNKKVDAIAIWEPIASNAALRLGADGLIAPNPKVYTQHFSLIASREAIDRREGALVRLLRAFASADRFIREQPAETRRILAIRLGDAALPDTIDQHEFRLSLDQSLIGAMDAQSRWALHEGLVEPEQLRSNLLRAIEPAALRQVAPRAVSLVR